MDSNSSSVQDIFGPSSFMSFNSLWVRLCFEIMVPNIAIFGLITNTLVVIVMPKKGLAVGRSAKIYYISIAIFDIINLFNSQVINTTLSESMYALYGEILYFYFS